MDSNLIVKTGEDYKLKTSQTKEVLECPDKDITVCQVKGGAVKIMLNKGSFKKQF